MERIFNQLIGRQRNDKGQFVKGNRYRLIKGQKGAVWFPNGWSTDKTCYNYRYNIHVTK